jgi:hypothetical protein
MARRNSKANLTLAEIAASSAPVDMPTQKRLVESRKWDDNPFVEPLREIVGTDNGKAVTVPANLAREVAAGIRDAAEKLTGQGVPTGVRLIFRYKADDGSDVQTTSANGNSLPEDDRNMTILYASRERRRSLTDDQRERATEFGDVFLTPDRKVNGRKFLEWEAAGSPVDDEGWPVIGKRAAERIG